MRKLTEYERLKCFYICHRYCIKIGGSEAKDDYSGIELPSNEYCSKCPDYIETINIDGQNRLTKGENLTKTFNEEFYKITFPPEYYKRDFDVSLNAWKLLIRILIEENDKHETIHTSANFKEIEKIIKKGILKKHEINPNTPQYINLNSINLDTGDINYVVRDPEDCLIFYYDRDNYNVFHNLSQQDLESLNAIISDIYEKKQDQEDGNFSGAV